MSFFDDNRRVGLALIVIGIIDIIATLALIVVLYYYIPADLAVDFITSAAISTVGTAIFGILIILFGKNVRKGPNDKVAILSGLFRVLGIAAILTGLCSAISNVMLTGSGTAIVTSAIGIITGLIYLWVSFKIAGGNKNVIGQILWVILLIFSLISILGSIAGFLTILLEGLLILFGVSLLSGIGILFGVSLLFGINSVCMLFVYAYVFTALLSPEVKKSMGV